jgi:hypothetical protein
MSRSYWKGWRWASRPDDRPASTCPRHSGKRCRPMPDWDATDQPLKWVGLCGECGERRY